MKRDTTYRQPWLYNARFDSVFILFPVFIALCVSLFLPREYQTTDNMPVAAWVILVLLIDVAHVYSTLFYTYFDARKFQVHKVLYTIIPVICFVAGVLLYSIGALVFWRVLAYLAVFHFIRQQYGFVRLYSRHEAESKKSTTINTIAIYTATLYPLVYWHCTPGRNFNWFVAGDFVSLQAPLIQQVTGVLYVIVILVYLSKEVINYLGKGTVNIPRNVLVAGTFLSWYVGIVYYNGDMTFTLLNVVAHGIPYMALIWANQNKQTNEQTNIRFFKGSMLRKVGVFLFVIVLLAYLEEGLWDGLIWREHTNLFAAFSWLPSLSSPEVLSFLVPLLSLPQSTHYILDGFIWKKNH